MAAVPQTGSTTTNPQVVSTTYTAPTIAAAQPENCAAGVLSIPGWGSFSIATVPFYNGGWGEIPGGNGVVYHLDRPTSTYNRYDEQGRLVSSQAGPAFGSFGFLAHNYTTPGRAINSLYYNGGTVCLNGQRYQAYAWGIIRPTDLTWLTVGGVFLKTTHEDEHHSYIVSLVPIY
jgi:hypothetical protein